MAKAYLQVYGDKGLIWPKSAETPGEEAKRLKFEASYTGFAGFDKGYSTLKGYVGGDQIQGKEWLPVQIEANMGPNPNITIDFADAESGKKSKAASTISKRITFAQGNKNPLNAVIVEVTDEHPEISAEGEFVLKIICLAKLSSLGEYGTTSMVTAEAAWVDESTCDENIASIFTSSGAGPAVENFAEFEGHWKAVVA